MAKKKGLITSKPTHNQGDMVRIRKLKNMVRQAKKVGAQTERQARKLKEACAKLLKDLDTGWEA